MFPKGTQRMIDFFFYIGVGLVGGSLIAGIAYAAWRLFA